MNNTIRLENDILRLDGTFPSKGNKATNFYMTSTNLEVLSLDDYKSNKIILNIFPSIDTPFCAKSVRRFNELASSLENTKVLCISKDLPFAFNRFCAGEGLENVVSLSDYRQNSSFGIDYGVLIIDEPLKYLLARAIIIIDEDRNIIYSKLSEQLDSEPDYDSALNALA